MGAGAVSSSCSIISGDESKEQSNIEWEEYFKGNFPTRTIVEISRLNGDDNIEITASVAYIP